jgi:hypothetical protein
LKGHHDHDGDRAHSKPQRQYYNTLKSGVSIGDPQQFCQIMSSLRHYSFFWKLGFLDFPAMFRSNYQEIPAISSTHLFKITSSGIFTKGVDISQPYGSWRTDPTIEMNGFKCYIGSTDLIAISLPKPRFSDEHIAILKRIKPPDFSKHFWENLISGGVGTDQVHVLSTPSFELKSHQSVALSHNEQVHQSAEHIDEVYVITKLGKLFWFEEEKIWKIETEYEGYEGVWYSVLDDLVDPDGTENELFMKWKAEHKVLANRFVTGTPPKQAEKNVDSGSEDFCIQENQTPSKGKLNQQASAKRKILSNGRGTKSVVRSKKTKHT